MLTKIPHFRSGTVLAPLLTCVRCSVAQRAMSVDGSRYFHQKPDQDEGRRSRYRGLFKKIKLTQRLDDRTIEDLQGQGAGPRTVAALKELAADVGRPPRCSSAGLAAHSPPPKPPSAKEQAEILEAMRDYALNYTKNLPNYICVQTTHRKLEATDALYQKGYHGYIASATSFRN